MSGRNIVRTNYTTGTEVSFNDVIYYKCATGYFFDEDKAMDGFTVTCQPGGTWSMDANLGGKFCVKPEGNKKPVFYFVDLN